MSKRARQDSEEQHASSSAETDKIIDGKEMAAQIRAEVAAEVHEVRIL
jgi:hypothetical protein